MSSFLRRLSNRPNPSSPGIEDSNGNPLLSVGAPNYMGTLFKKGHIRQNWKERHFVVRGCTVSYYETAAKAKALNDPKGVVIITGIRDDNPNSTCWVMDTSGDKSFELRAHSLAEKLKFLQVMRAAIEKQEKSNISSETDADRDKVNWKINIALELGSNGYVEQAIEKFEELTHLHGDNPEIFFHLGSCRLVEGKEISALEAFDHALKHVSPTSNVALYCDIMNNLGLAHFILGNFSESKSFYKESLSYRPKDEETIVNLVVAHIECEEYKDAEILLKDILINALPSVEALLNWTHVLLATDRVSAAMDSLRRLISLHPAAHEGYYMLGEVYERQNDFLTASKYYERAYSLQDHRSKYSNALSRVRLALAEMQEEEVVQSGTNSNL